MLGVFEKARAVLDLYTTARPEWGVTEVARELQLAVSSAHVLMASLAGMGLLHRTSAGRYRLGFKLLALSQVLLSNTPWREVAREEMDVLARQHGETLLLAALDGDELVNLMSVTGRGPGRAEVPRDGAALPIQRSASGRLIVAHRPAKTARRMLGGMRAAGASAEVLHEEAQALSESLRQGVAVYEDAAGWSVAAPVRNHNGEVIAALSLHAPPGCPPERRALLRGAVVAAGERVSVRIGYSAELSGGERPGWISVKGQDRLRAGPRRLS